MALEAKKYRQAFEPENIIQILPKRTIRHMIRGFFLKLRQGVTLWYAEYAPNQGRWLIQDDPIDPFDYTSRKDRVFFNKMCLAYRDKMGHDACHEIGQTVAQAYVDNNRTGALRYPCWLGLEDSSLSPPNCSPCSSKAASPATSNRPALRSPKRLSMEPPCRALQQRWRTTGVQSQER